MYDDIHLFGGAPSGASWCIDGILCFKNKILGGEFGGYTAHHYQGLTRAVLGKSLRIPRFSKPLDVELVVLVEHHDAQAVAAAGTK
jgi:hypothetical protein